MLLGGRVLLKHQNRTLHLLEPGVGHQSRWLDRVIALVRFVCLADRARVDTFFVGALAVSTATELLFDAHEVLLSVTSNLRAVSGSNVLLN